MCSIGPASGEDDEEEDPVGDGERDGAYSSDSQPSALRVGCFGREAGDCQFRTLHIAERCKNGL